MKKYSPLILILLSVNSSLVWAIEKDPEFGMLNQETMFDLHEKEEQQKAHEFEIEQRNFSYLQNNFYENDHVRIYNNSAYQLDNPKNPFAEPKLNDFNLKDLDISLGYGMEFKLNHDDKVGYEYRSTFPYDRGQMLRLFWSKDF